MKKAKFLRLNKKFLPSYLSKEKPPKRLIISSFRGFLRFLADSNRRKRFCRPVPNHSAKEPYFPFANAKIVYIFYLTRPL